MRLVSIDQVSPELRPGCCPIDHGVGIVHLGLGAFHRAHQAGATDKALAAAPLQTLPGRVMGRRAGRQ